MWHVMRLVVMPYGCGILFQLWELLTPFLDRRNYFVIIPQLLLSLKTLGVFLAAKHIDVKFYFVKEKVVESLIDIEHMSTKGMLADPLTKGLPMVVFHEHVSQMGFLEA